MENFIFCAVQIMLRREYYLDFFFLEFYGIFE